MDDTSWSMGDCAVTGAYGGYHPLLLEHLIFFIKTCGLEEK